MKLSLEIIKNHLESTENITSFKSVSDSLALVRPVFYAGESALKSDTLYIGLAGDFDNVRSIGKNVSCICIGSLKKRISAKIDYLLLAADTDLFTLFNHVSAVFDLFDEWENDLFRAAYASRLKERYQAMLDISSKIFENGLTIMNNELHIIYQNEINLKYGGYIIPDPEDIEDFAIPDEIISAFKYDEEYKRISEEQEVFYYEGEMLPHRVLAKNIFLNGRFLFRVIITECLRPLRKTDEVLLEYLSQHFIQNLKQLSLQNVAIGEGLNHLLVEMLETGKNNRLAIDSELRRISWNYTDSFRLASIQVSPDDLFIASLDYYAIEAAKLFPAALAFPYNEHIILIVNESRSGALDQKTEALSVFVRENNFRIGLSNYTDDFYNLQKLYRQAEMALLIGMTENPTEWIHWFSRYTLQYIYNLLTNDSGLGQLYSPIYYQLERYDKENGSSYLKTLRVYLACRMNAVKAAKELYIQRSTMIYRLKRIREITDNSLENDRDLLHLYLTFSIIEST